MWNEIVFKLYRKMFENSFFKLDDLWSQRIRCLNFFEKQASICLEGWESRAGSHRFSMLLPSSPLVAPACSKLLLFIFVAMKISYPCYLVSQGWNIFEDMFRHVSSSLLTFNFFLENLAPQKLTLSVIKVRKELFEKQAPMT